MIGQTLSHYRVLEKIGAGGMGVVYRAHDDRLDRDVALKVLPSGTLSTESARNRIRKEALALSRLNHPNIETVHDFGSQDGVDFLVIEYIAGLPLDQKLTQSAFAEKELLRLALQLAEGLAAAHGQGLVHCDLKPGNLLITADGRLKILDFGIARLLHPAVVGELTATATQAEAAVGTLPYMSPEQLRGEEIDGRSDLWAAGAVLYEMATGRRAFAQPTAPQLTEAILHQAPSPPRATNSRISPELERIILKCLEKDPEDRYQSARELTIDLRRLATPTAGPTRSRAASRRVPLLGIGGLVVLLALLAASNVGGWRSRLFPGRTQIESLAVLPLQNLSGDPAQDYFVDGMTEQLTADVAQLSALRVISTSSAISYKGAKEPLPQIARELHVDAVVEGAVQRVGNRVRITAHLIYAPTDRHLWARTYERDVRDVLSLQDEVAQTIAAEVGGQLNPLHNQHLANSHHVNPAAYEAFLRGSYSGDLQKAIDYFQQAAALDPDFARPYAGMAEAYFLQGFFNLQPPDVAFGKMRAAALTAVAKDESLSDGHDVLALAKLQYDWDWKGAEKEFQRALELNPNDANSRHDYSHFLMATGRIDESVAESNRAVQLDPLDRGLTACLCWHRYSAHQYSQSVAQVLKALSIEPNDDWSHVILGWDYEQEKKYDQAIAEFQKALKLSNGGEFALAALGHAYAASGRKSQAQDVLKQLQHRHGYVSAFDIAVIYAGLGDKEKAFAWLDKAAQEHSSFLIYSRWEPRLDPLRSDVRFAALLQRIGIPTV